MLPQRLLLDTVFIQALLNRRDQYHRRALAWLPEVRAAVEVWVTEAVLIEVANALGTFDRAGAASFIQSCYHTPNMRVVNISTPLLSKALEIYRSRRDKTWGLTARHHHVVDSQGLRQTTGAPVVRRGSRDPRGGCPRPRRPRPGGS